MKIVAVEGSRFCFLCFFVFFPVEESQKRARIAQHKTARFLIQVSIMAAFTLDSERFKASMILSAVGDAIGYHVREK
jgi:hypothetical protein